MYSSLRNHPRLFTRIIDNKYLSKASQKSSIKIECVIYDIKCQCIFQIISMLLTYDYLCKHLSWLSKLQNVNEPKLTQPFMHFHQKLENHISREYKHFPLCNLVLYHIMYICQGHKSITICMHVYVHTMIDILQIIEDNDAQKLLFEKGQILDFSSKKNEYP